MIAVLKGVFLYGLFWLITAVIGSLITATFVGKSDEVAKNVHDAVIYAIAVVVGLSGGDAFMRACFRGSYPRKIIINTAIIMWLFGAVILVPFFIIVVKIPLYLIDWVRPSASIATFLYLRWDEQRHRKMVANADFVSDPSTPREVSFMDGFVRLFGSLAFVLPQLLFLMWGLAQLAAVYAQIHAFTHFPGIVSGIVAFVVTYIPIVGSVIGFFGAKDVWGWDWWQAAGLYWGAPIVLTIISIVVGAIGAAAERLRA